MAKETYSVAKETYSVAKETYFVKKETYSVAKETNSVSFFRVCFVFVSLIGLREVRARLAVWQKRPILHTKETYSVAKETY